MEITCNYEEFKRLFKTVSSVQQNVYSLSDNFSRPLSSLLRRIHFLFRKLIRKIQMHLLSSENHCFTLLCIGAKTAVYIGNERLEYFPFWVVSIFESVLYNEKSLLIKCRIFFIPQHKSPPKSFCQRN